MKKITFTNSRGESIELYKAPLFLNKVEGLGDVDADIKNQKSPGQDGSTHIDTLLEERYISLEVVIVSDLIDNRQYMSRVFNPKLGEGLLVFEDGDVKRQILAIPEHAPTFPDDRPSPAQKATLDLICPNPYWKSEGILEDPTFEPLFEFPFYDAFEMGIQRDVRIIDNDGDVQVPIQVEFYGPAVNPRIVNNTTGEYIKVNQSLGENEYMRIDTTRGKKSVMFIDITNGSERNVFNWIDLDSTFFDLELGENEIEYTADNDIQGVIVNIYWQKHYVGV